MTKSKTYFAQVPLEVVKKIVEEQIQAEAASVPDQGIEEETQIEVFREMERPSMAQSLAPAEEETSN